MKPEPISHNPAGGPFADRPDPLLDLGRHWKAPRPLIRGVECLMRLDGVNAIYRALPTETDPFTFYEAVLEIMGVGYELITRNPVPLPEKGPLLVVANHPFGGIDGLVLGAAVTRWRPDSRFLVNYLLGAIPEMAARMIPVDPFGRETSSRANLKGMRECLRVLKGGGCIATFPSGEVSHWQPGKGGVQDPAWSPHLVNLARRTGATIVPLFFDGRNSALFHALGLLHPRLRTFRLPAELVNRRGSLVRVVAGEPIVARRLEEFDTDAAATEFIRLQTMLLRGRLGGKPAQSFLPVGWKKIATREAGSAAVPIISPVARDLLREDIRNLPPDARLVEHSRFDVYLADAGMIPNILEEIGRTREVTFRLADEGTGKAKDLDAFDQTYLHLFLWDKIDSAIAGAYRLGLTDELLEKYGKKGLYTHTLFRMDPGFMESIQPAIELGRSYIVPEYQKKHATLVLLWKGIGAFLVRKLKYRYLFGPVSIDKEYQALSKDILVQFLTERMATGDGSRAIRARHPLRLKGLYRGEKYAIREFVNDIDQVSALISEVEASGKGVPTLLRHYVKLNARLLAFNVDPAFNDSVDSLMLCDLVESDPKLIGHYLGKQGARDFLEYHQRRGAVISI